MLIKRMKRAKQAEAAREREMEDDEDDDEDEGDISVRMKTARSIKAENAARGKRRKAAERVDSDDE